MSTLLQLRTQIKTESRNKGVDNPLDSWIDFLINQLTLEYAQRGMFKDLLTVSTAVTLVNLQESYNLPVDFLKVLRMLYTSSTRRWKLNERKSLVEVARVEGKPYMYELVGSTVKINPASGVAATDTCILDYYKRPTTLSADGDNYPVADLEPTLVHDTVSRIRQFHEKPELATLQIEQGKTSYGDAQNVSS